MEEGRNHHHHAAPADVFSHGILRLHHIGDYIRQGAVVTDRPGEDEGTLWVTHSYIIPPV